MDVVHIKDIIEYNHSPTFYYDYVSDQTSIGFRHVFVIETADEAYKFAMNKCLESVKLNDFESAKTSMLYIYGLYKKDRYPNGFWHYFVPEMMETYPNSKLTIKYKHIYFDGKEIPL